MPCFPNMQKCRATRSWLWRCSTFSIIFFTVFVQASSALSHGAPMSVPCVNAIVPYADDPPLWIRAADLLHQGLMSSSSGASTGAGFGINIEANITTVAMADCKLDQKKKAMATMKLSLYQSKMSSSKLLSRDLVSVPVPVSCKDAYTFFTVHYGIAALGPFPSALPHQISASASLPLTFSYCIPTIAQTGYGALFFGVRYPSSSYPYKLPSSSLTKAPMSIIDRYSLHLTSVEMMSNSPSQNEKLSLGHGGYTVILSSIATHISFPNSTYQYIYKRITMALSKRGIPEYKFDLLLYPTSGCYQLKKADFLALPKIKLVFSGKVPLILDASDYFLLARDSVYCINIYENDEAVLGLIAQQNRLVEFDLEKKTFGFSEPLSKFNTSCALSFPSS